MAPARSQRESGEGGPFPVNLKVPHKPEADLVIHILCDLLFYPARSMQWMVR